MENQCKTCLWCKRKRDGTLICASVDSECFGECILASQTCEEWEEK